MPRGGGEAAALVSALLSRMPIWQPLSLAISALVISISSGGALGASGADSRLGADALKGGPGVDCGALEMECSLPRGRARDYGARVGRACAIRRRRGAGAPLRRLAGRPR